MDAALQAERKRVHSAAMSISATEAILFLYDASGRVPLTTALHIRPGEKRAAKLAEADAAFRSVVTPCLASGKDVAVVVEKRDDPRDPQYCFVHIGTRKGAIARAAAFIRRCPDADTAKEVLMQVRERRIFN